MVSPTLESPKPTNFLRSKAQNVWLAISLCVCSSKVIFWITVACSTVMCITSSSCHAVYCAGCRARLSAAQDSVCSSTGLCYHRSRAAIMGTLRPRRLAAGNHDGCTQSIFFRPATQAALCKDCVPSAAGEAAARTAAAGPSATGDAGRMAERIAVRVWGSW